MGFRVPKHHIRQQWLNMVNRWLKAVIKYMIMDIAIAIHEANRKQFFENWKLRLHIH